MPLIISREISEEGGRQERREVRGIEVGREGKRRGEKRIEGKRTGQSNIEKGMGKDDVPMWKSTPFLSKGAVNPLRI